MANTRNLSRHDYLNIIYYFLDGSEEDKKKFVDALNSHPIMGEYPATDKQLKRTASKYFFNFLFNNKTENSLSSSTTSIPHLTHLVNLPNATNKSPLMHAVETQNFHAVKFLLENGAELQFHIVFIALCQYLEKRDDNLYQITKSTTDTELINKALNIFFYILDFMIQKNLPELQEKLPPLLLHYLKNTCPEDFSEVLFYKIANAITDFSKPNYFHFLMKFQNLEALLFLLKKTKDARFTQLNQEHYKETPLILIYVLAPTSKDEPTEFDQHQNWFNCIELLLSQVEKIPADDLFKIENILKAYKPKIIVGSDPGLMFLSPNETTNLLYRREAWFSLCLQKYNIALVNRSCFENLRKDNLLHPNLIYCVKDQDDINLVYTHQNQLFSLEKNIDLNSIKEILNKQRSTPSYDVNEPPEKQTYLSSSESNAADIYPHALIAIKQDQRKRNISPTFKGVDIKHLIEITNTPSLDMDWTFVDLRGAIFEKNWIGNSACVPSLVGVQLNLETLNNNGFFIQENPKGLFDKRFEDDTKQLKNKFVSDYLAYFKKGKKFYSLLNTLYLFTQDTQHIVRLNQDKNKPLFGDTKSFTSIMREGQARLHALSQETGFLWDSQNVNAQQQLNDIFKTNYTEIKEAHNEIMQISVSTPDHSSGLINSFFNLFSPAPAPTTTAVPAPTTISSTINSLFNRHSPVSTVTEEPETNADSNKENPAMASIYEQNL